MDDTVRSTLVYSVFTIFLVVIFGMALMMAGARIAQKTGHKGLSLKLSRIVAKLARNDGSSHLQLARSLVQNDQFEEAIQEYTKVLQLEVNGNAYFELADVFEKLGRKQDAINTYQGLLIIVGPNPLAEDQLLVQEAQSQISRLTNSLS